MSLQGNDFALQIDQTRWQELPNATPYTMIQPVESVVLSHIDTVVNVIGQLCELSRRDCAHMFIEGSCPHTPTHTYTTLVCPLPVFFPASIPIILSFCRYLPVIIMFAHPSLPCCEFQRHIPATTPYYMTDKAD